MAHPLHAFIVAAKANGADDMMVLQLLKESGWPEDQVLEAYQEHYVTVTGVPVPTPQAGKRVSARDAFYYFVSFLTLGIWSTALGSMLFVFINRKFGESYNMYYEPSVSFQLAAIIIALPVYLWMSRLIARDLAENPGKVESGVRRWLTFIILFITAGTVIGDLIALLTGLLEGELTTTFLLKVLTILVIAGGIFLYYYWEMRRTVAATAKKS